MNRKQPKPLRFGSGRRQPIGTPLRLSDKFVIIDDSPDSECDHGFKEPNCYTCDPHGHCTSLCEECHGNTKKDSKR